MKSLSFFDDHYPVTTVITDRDDNAFIEDKSAKSYRKYFKDMRKLPVDRLVKADETHSSNVLVIDRQDSSGRLEYIDETQTIRHRGGHDSIITSVPGVMIAITTADCVPVFLYDRAKNIAAIVHSGWRGTVRGIAVHTLAVMSRLFASDPADVTAAFGVCICGDCYEVGPELTDLFAERFGADDLKAVFKPAKEGKLLLDVKEAVRRDLICHGLPEKNMYDTGICSFESENYPSFRRDGDQAGLYTLSGIILNPEA